MKKHITSFALAALTSLTVGLTMTGAAHAQNPAPTAAAATPDAVTVVIQVSLLPGASQTQALASMQDMRAMVKKQPGLLSEEFLQNLNPANTPTNVHVTRWAAFKYWESVFTSAEFARLNAAGTKQYTVTASAFKAAN
jgi:heme-degrading monooxygenase HmoA